MVSDVGHNPVMRAIVSAPQLEYGVNFGIGEPRPRLSWSIESDSSEWSPDCYEATLWRGDGEPESELIPSEGQVFEDWPFAPLNSRERFSVSIRIGSGGQWSPPSRRTVGETGLLKRDDWSAVFVSPVTFGGLDDAAPIVFTTVELPSTPRSARLYVTAKGLYEFSINGEKVGNDLLTPGWTAYERRIRYQSYDVIDKLRAGSNDLQALLGNGWYRGQLVWPGNRESYGNRLALLAQLEVTVADGSVLTFATDGSWQAVESGILSDDLYDGQLRDLRVTNSPQGTVVQGVVVIPDELVDLVAPLAPPVRVTEVLEPLRLLTSRSGKRIIDFGQNLVGWVELTVRRGKPGSQVIIRHAEVLEEGELGVRPLRSAKAISSYILAGGEREVLAPTFTYHGFRYAEISGVENLDLGDVRALVIGSALRRTGWFESSSAELNQLHSNIVWSMRGNFLDVPTDCPARDERLGWTGDIQVFAPTANFLYDTSGFLCNWLRDLAAEQRADGGVPNVIPDVLREPDPASAAWGDAATIVPYSLFDAFGDRGVLASQYGSMVTWVEKVGSIAGPRLIWDSGEQFGDWLDPTAPPDDPSRAQADPAVVATAHFARSTLLVAKTAQELGHLEDAAHYQRQYADIVQAFNREFISEGGVVTSDCQTVYALALEWDLFDTDRQRQFGAIRLAELVRDAGYRVSTGFVGTPLILSALERAGHPELAMTMLLQDETPSWLYAVKMGATTIWERWDSMLPDGSINPGSMTSFNHYAYGAVADWLHRSIAGLAPLEPGYRRIRVRPVLVGELSSASARHHSPYGPIQVSWSRVDGVLTLSVELPFGVTAEVWLPGSEESTNVGRGVHSFTTVLE